MAPGKRKVQLDTTKFLSIKKKKIDDPIQKLQAKLNADLDHPYVRFYYGLNDDALSMTNPSILFNSPVHILKQLPICPKVLINLDDDDDDDTRTFVIQRDVQFCCTFNSPVQRPICSKVLVKSEDDEEDSGYHDDTRVIIIQHTDED